MGCHMATDDYKTAPNRRRIVWKVVTKVFQEGQYEVYSSCEPADPDRKLYRIGETTIQEKEGARILVLFPFEAARAFASNRKVCILQGWTETLSEENDPQTKSSKRYLQDGRESSLCEATEGAMLCRSFHPTVKVYDYSVPVRKLILQDIADIWRVRVDDIPGSDSEKAELLDCAKRMLEEGGEEYFRTALGPMDHWRNYQNGVIP